MPEFVPGNVGVSRLGARGRRISLAAQPPDTGQRRLSVCYVAPAQYLLPSAGPTRNVLELAHALTEWADVTVAFRRVVESPTDLTVPVLEIESAAVMHPRSMTDDSAMRGVGYREFVAYLMAVRRFAREQLSRFDVVLEKSWLLSGYVSHLCHRRGVPAVPVENLVPVVSRARWGAAKAGRNWVALNLAGHYLRHSPVVVAETEHLKAAMIDRLRITPDRIEVVGLGVDRSLFRPRDQAEARRRLGIPAEATVLVYAGILDEAHDLAPALQALVRLRDPMLRLEIVGDGPHRADLEAQAEAGIRGTARFHGAVPHRDVSDFIAAADLCIAPYDTRKFPNGQLGYATLKVREYLAAGRPVATVPSGALRELIHDGESGFLLANDVQSWLALLRRLPSHEELRRMGEAAAATPLESWQDAARSYYAVLRRVLRGEGRPRASA